MADGKAHLSSTLDQLSGNARCHLMQESITVSLKELSAQTGRALYGMCNRGLSSGAVTNPITFTSSILQMWHV